MGRHAWRFADSVALPVEHPLDAAQQAVVAWTEGPALVLGGPGTGKTSTMVAAALERLAEGADPASVVMLTFGRDAAADLRQRLVLRLGAGEPPRVATFHALALDIVMRAQGNGAPLRLLSGAEQERAVRDVIDGTLEDPDLRGAWPADLREALGTRGFAKEVRAAFAAARALGLAGDEIARIGRRAGNPAWTAVGPVLDEYLDAQDQQEALDYAELMFRAVQAVHDPANRELFRGIHHVIVDEYQDTDRMQVALLRELGRFATSLVAFGDPDQSIYAFRGAEVRNVRAFDDDFADMARAHGLQAPGLLALTATHRYGPAIRNYAVGSFAGVAPAGLTGPFAERHRMPRCAPEHGVVRAFVYDDPLSEAAWIASGIRELAQSTGAAWDSFAVLTRSSSALGTIERALRRNGIPCTSDVGDARLADEPAVLTLLRALEVVSARELVISPAHAHELLLSPLCGIDPTDLRAIGRALRVDRTVTSDVAIAAALAAPHPALHLDAGSPGVERFEALRMLLQHVHSRVAAGTTPHEALWLLWSGTRWPSILRRQALEQGSALAHRDLDAVCALFDIADRSVQRRQGHAGVSAFLYELRAQDVPAETLAGRGFRGPAVQLLTAHRAKGLEWDHVFVAGVSEGVWPNLQKRGAVLDVDRLTASGLVEPRGRAALFDEERRLFYVALTRARHTLTVSGAAGEGDAAQPSRLLVHPQLTPTLRPGRPATVDSAAGLVAELRRVATSESQPAALRAAAVRRLGTLLRLRDDAGALFPEADPERWWGARAATVSPRPVDPVDEPLYVRASSLETLSKCSLAWFLQQRAHADGVRGSAVVFGSAIHALIDGVTRGELEASAEAMSARLLEVWNQAGYDADWQSQRDLQEAFAAIGRFLHWQAARRDVSVASEVGFGAVVDIRTPSGRTEQLAMRGTIDRLEVDADGTAVVFDFKTSRGTVTQGEAREHAQLRYYQYAVAQGLLDGRVTGPAPSAGLRPGGAQLVYLRLDGGRDDPAGPKTLLQPPLEGAAEEWATTVLGEGLDTVRGESFEAVSGKHCAFCSMHVVCPLQPEGRVEGA